MKVNPRVKVVKQLIALFAKGRSLSELAENIQKEDQAPLIQAMCYGVARYYIQLDFAAKQLLSKPMKEKDQDIYLLILIGLFQMMYMRVPDHAAISETVDAVKAFKKPWAKGLVNAILRNFQRKKETLLKTIEQNEQAKFSYPVWIIDKVKKAYPNTWEQILHAGNEQAPMTLRVNQSSVTTKDYLKLLNEVKITGNESSLVESAIILEQAVPVTKLPKFKEGFCSVQDAAAQLAAGFLKVEPGMRVLDACAAPGGKTSHLLESVNAIQLTAIDNVASRVEKIHENLNRLHLKASVKCADVLDSDAWWDGELFDRILLDAPCSASGVIRRHPDIKHLRLETDIEALVKLQSAMLGKLWGLLKPGGLLLYATCSIFPEENNEQIAKFIKKHSEAKEVNLMIKEEKTSFIGAQLLPGELNSDGFYYLLLQKKA